MIYEWQCKKCGEVMEVERKLSDYKVPPIETHRGDHEHQWERVIGGTSTPFQHLRHAGVFADEYGNYAPWSRNMK
jgi:hypothetical protein